MRRGRDRRPPPINRPVRLRDLLIRRRMLVRRRRWPPAIRLHRLAEPRHPVPRLLLHLPLELVPAQQRTYPVARRRPPVAVVTAAQGEQHQQPHRASYHLEHDRNCALAVASRARRAVRGGRRRPGTWDPGVGDRVTRGAVPGRMCRVNGNRRDEDGVRRGRGVA